MVSVTSMLSHIHTTSTPHRGTNHLRNFPRTLIAHSTPHVVPHSTTYAKIVRKSRLSAQKRLNHRRSQQSKAAASKRDIMIFPRGNVSQVFLGKLVTNDSTLNPLGRLFLRQQRHPTNVKALAVTPNRPIAYFSQSSSQCE